MTEPYKEELSPFLFPEQKPYGSYEEVLVARSLHFYISSELIEPEHYVEMIHKIRTASMNDQIHIHLNTPGGDITTGVQIINAINNSMGFVTTHLDGSVCSMGSLIFLTGHEAVAYENSLLMFHNYSMVAGGKGHELKSMFDAQEQWYDDIQERILLPFLTKAELGRIKKGEDIWMQHDDIIKRLAKVQKAAEKKMAQIEEELDIEL